MRDLFPSVAALQSRSLAILATLGLMLAGLGAAQPTPVDVETVLDNVTQAALDLRDASLLVTGNLIGPDGTTISLEIDILLIPPESLASAYIIQPDALADNQILLDGGAVYNYTFLTHQVMIFDADDPDALGGLLPTGEDGATAEISFDLAALFASYQASIAEVTPTDGGLTYLLRFTSIDPDALVLNAEATVPDSDWLPRRLVFMEADGRVLAILNAENLRINQGLDPDDVRILPDDAEVIDNRR